MAFVPALYAWFNIVGFWDPYAHTSQIRVAAKGYTIVPLELYFIGGRVKVEIALAKGKQEWDKRQALREKQDQREAERAMRRYVKQARR